MVNANKSKGDRAEREAVAWLMEHPVASALVDVPNPGRMKAAGIPEDVGDLWVFTDAAVQVKSYRANSLGAAVREAALGAQAQKRTAHRPHGVGMVKVPGARTGSVQWIASTCHDEWPLTAEPVVEFSRISDAITWMRDDSGPKGYLAHPRPARLCALAHGTSARLLLAPMDTWLAALSAVRNAKTLEEAA